MMAEVNGSSVLPEGEDGFAEDPRSPDGKKKKFKPFQKMKNFFRGSSKKRFKGEEDEKFHSTSALHGTNQRGEDEDDGGFRKSFAGSRSISEDSIFKPDLQKEAPAIGVLHGQAVSMEGITQAFQSELFNKLKARQSDSDIDEGLPYSPVPTLTSSNPAFYTHEQSVPAPGSQPSPTRDSEQSLISVDGNSDEDLFTSNWKSGVASVKTARQGRSSSAGSLPDSTSDMDFEAVAQLQGTMSLSNEAAKHRISVKPKSRRLSSKMSMKSRERPNVQTKLPEVQEETSRRKTLAVEPPVEAKSSAEAATVPHKTVLSTTIPVSNPGTSSGGAIPRSEPREIQQPVRHREEPESSRSRSMSPLSTSPMSASVIQEVKLRPRPTSGRFDNVDINKEAPVAPKNELAQAFNRAKRISRKYDDSGNVVETSSAKSVSVDVSKDSDHKKQDVNIRNSLVSNQEKKPASAALVTTSAVDATSTTTIVPTSPEVSTNSGVSFVLKKEPLKASSKMTEKPKPATNEPKDTTVAQVKETPQLENKPVGVVGPSAQKSPTADTTMNFPYVEIKPETKSPAKLWTGSPEKLATPREEYRLKRAVRSKTLPVSKEMVEKAEEAEISKQKNVLEKRAGSPPLESKKRLDYENVIDSNPIQSKRASWAPAGAATQASTEPFWITKNRLKKTEEVKDLKNDSNKKEIKIDVKTTSQATGSSLTATKSESANESKTQEKQTSEAKPVRSWAQTHSARPFEKSTSQSSVKPPVSGLSSSMKSSFDKPSVQSTSISATPVSSTSVSTKPPASVRQAFDSSRLGQSTATKAGGFERSFSQKTSSVTAKPTASVTTKQATVGIGKPTTSVTNKPTASVSTKSALDSNKPSISPVKPLGIVNKNVKQDMAGGDIKKPFPQENKKIEIEGKKDNAVTLSPAKQPFSTKSDTNASVPAWKQSLRKNNTGLAAPSVNIEIIDKNTEKKEPEKRVSEKPGAQLREKTPSTPERCADNRPSKVSDMIKNFQKLQAT